MSDETLSRVILSWPSTLSLADAGDAAPRSWIQLARTGSFVSSRYGKFSITKDDLSQMLHNFSAITPKAPTELVVDYDHLSQNPRQPGDSAAAAWIKKLELRENGDELWGEVEWTPDGAERVRKQEYRFISPSFVKGHVHKDGRKIGTTLIAAAVTNSPFLEGMKAVTLGNAAIRALNLSAALRDVVAVEDGAVHLAEIGQRVTFKDDAEQTPELTDDERRETFIVKSTIGGGDDQFVRLATDDGQEFGWFRATQLAPARAKGTPIPAGKPPQEDTTMHRMHADADDELLQLANTIAQAQGISLRDAAREAGKQRPDLADQRRADIGVESADDDPETPAPPVIHLRAGESFFALCQRTAAERQIHLSMAIRMVSAAHPTLAEAYSRGDSV